MLPVTYFLFASCRCYLFQSEHVALIYSCNVSLVRSWWESARIQFNLWSVYYMFLWWDVVPTSLWGKLHPVPTAVIWHILYLRHYIILFSVSLIPVYYHRICYFPVMGGVKRDEGCGAGWLQVSEERRGISRRAGDKKRKGADTPFCIMKCCERTIWIKSYCLSWFFCCIPFIENQVNSET